MNWINPITMPAGVGDIGTLSIDTGQVLTDFVKANPVLTMGLVALIGLGLYQLLKN